MAHYYFYPSWISPNIIPESLLVKLPTWLHWLGFLKWYGMMYVVATVIIYKLVNYQIQKEDPSITTEETEKLFTYGIIGLILGARLMATLVWDDTFFYLSHPWMIFLPLDENWHFVGFQGMAFHGGLLGTILGIGFYCYQSQHSFLKWLDRISIAFPLGYTFGRLGNFFNAELYGRPTDHGLIFPNARPYSLLNSEVYEFVEKIKLPFSQYDNFINLPRHPSQLYEAFGEGILLFLFMWFFVRPKTDKLKGTASCFYLIGYGIIRFIIEYFRDPTDELGFIIQLQQVKLFKISLLNLSLGQILCLIMVLIGLVFLKFFQRKDIQNNEKKLESS